jgi:hypothetical protein
MEDISLHILDIAENSIDAGATLIKITITEDTDADVLSVEIEDNGRGIPEDLIEEVLNPFYSTRKTRKIGLGLSLLAQSARETGGDLLLQSKENRGTVVTAHFIPSHIDMKPLGNIADTILVLVAGTPEIDFVFSHERNGNTYSLDTRSIKADLDGVPINSPSVLSALKKYLCESLDEIRR